MAERLTIVVSPPEKEGELLTIADAMQQVLDAFDLLNESYPSDEITWRLWKANTNSPPFTVIAEARSVSSGVEADLIAKNQKRHFSSDYQKAKRGILPDNWSKKRARNFFHRNVNGIGVTEIRLDENNSISVTREDARNIDELYSGEGMETFTPRSLQGSIEGQLVDVSTHYNQPAIQVHDRLSGRSIWCVVSDEEHQRQIANEASFQDVWDENRIRVIGRLWYNAKGEVTRVDVDEIQPIQGRRVFVEEIRDPEFTGGLSPKEYIDKFREGEIE